jgi:PPOX class probable F420-dependent enzyme
MPDAKAVLEDKADIFRAKSFAHVATIGSQGEPHNQPVWVDFDGEHILFSQTKTRQKVRNLKKDPRVSVSVTDPDNPYRYIEVRGVVDEIVEDEGNAFINSMAKKYMDKDEYPAHRPGDERVVVKVRPEHSTSMG